MARNNLPRKVTIMKNKNKDERMTIYEYEERYVRRRNVKAARIILWVLAGLIGVFLAWCLLSVTLQLWNINKYAGYAAAGVSVILFIVLFIVPLVKIFRLNYFKTNVPASHAAAAKRHNRRVRRNIAERMVDFGNRVDNAGWYDDAILAELAVHLKNNDDEGIKRALTAMYSGKVKKTAKDYIFRYALRSAAYSALSQSSRTDAMLVAVVNLQLIKDIVFLYGFRPSDTQLLKIFAAVVRNSLVSYGLGSLKIGNGIVKTMGDAAKGIPILGAAISALVDSSVQGLTNGTLTAVIGFQTIRYLNKEYKLQNILDGVEVAESEEELQQTCNDIESELRKKPRTAKAAV